MGYKVVLDDESLFSGLEFTPSKRNNLVGLVNSIIEDDAVLQSAAEAAALRIAQGLVGDCQDFCDRQITRTTAIYFRDTVDGTLLLAIDDSPSIEQNLVHNFASRIQKAIFEKSRYLVLPMGNKIKDAIERAQNEDRFIIAPQNSYTIFLNHGKPVFENDELVQKIFGVVGAEQYSDFLKFNDIKRASIELPLLAYHTGEPTIKIEDGKALIAPILLCSENLPPHLDGGNLCLYPHPGIDQGIESKEKETPSTFPILNARGVYNPVDDSILDF
ncbi:hypothetical protein GOV04_01250 [Candidatus Woesearchaeota archaeon]|nr:hypothetical protein [Candidatus Woesearchaeota archaeon]